MSKAVLISIRPEWCEKIASGQKTIEVRKTYPKIDTPFKCYIYETKAINHRSILVDLDGEQRTIFAKGRGKIIGEFICDGIYRYTAAFFRGEAREKGMTITDSEMERQSCLTQDELYRYENSDNNHRWGLLGWHISDLVIYDKPKELSEFRKHGFRTGYKIVNDNRRGVVSVPFTCENAPLQRPPQSWCYVEEVR